MPVAPMTPTAIFRILFSFLSKNALLKQKKPECHIRIRAW
jgi:hypothetical protein